MESRIKTYSYPGGEIQRVQIVRFDSFSDLRFYRPEYDAASFDRLCTLFRDFIVKKFAKVVGKLVIFRVPEDTDIPFGMSFGENGVFYDRLTAVTNAFRNSIRSRGRRLVFSDPVVESYFKALQASGDLMVAEGERNKVNFMPFCPRMGFLSKGSEKRDLAFNCSFFEMDQFDCSTTFDQVGVPVGLCVQNGTVVKPPQFSRQALMVSKDGSVSISYPQLRDLAVVIDGVPYKHNVNCRFYERPSSRRTPKGKADIVVVDNRIVAMNPDGGTAVPGGGFVIQLFDKVPGISDLVVQYRGMEDIAFAVQVGNSAVVDGKPTDRFLSPFYKLWNILCPSYPPSTYPQDYKGARAPRMVLGADKDDRPMLLWFEGAGKFGYEKGKGSCGASLSECAAIASDLGMHNGIHLDGGGSAQILLSGRRALQVSDRKAQDFSEVERAIPMALVLGGSV